MNNNATAGKYPYGFSLVEVVLALAIFSGGIVVIVNLIAVLLQVNGDTVQNTRAANTVSRILAVRRSAPCVELPAYGTGALLPRLNQPYTGQKQTAYITEDGTVVPDAGSAAFFAIYCTGTNDSMGRNTSGVYVALTWPAGAAGNTRNLYEVYTTVAW